MDGRAPDPIRKHIDYHLTQLGVRVSEQACQLISRTYAGWTPIGPLLALPLQVPDTAADLQPGHVLQETAFNIMQRDPQSDLRALLQQEMTFDTALMASPPQAAASLQQ